MTDRIMNYLVEYCVCVIDVKINQRRTECSPSVEKQKQLHLLQCNQICFVCLGLLLDIESLINCKSIERLRM